MQLIFIHGPAACGKLTVATELASLTGVRLFHNHLTVDLVAALFEFGSEPFIRLRESIWLDAFREAAETNQSLIFTFHPEASVHDDFPERVVSLVTSRGGEVLFVELTCHEGVVERRIESETRAKYGKLRSLAEYRRLRAAGAFEFPPLPEPVISLDTSDVAPLEGARRIAAVMDRPED